MKNEIEVICPTLKHSPDPDDRLRPFAIATKLWTHRLWERLSGRPAHLTCTACGAALPDGRHLVYVRKEEG